MHQEFTAYILAYRSLISIHAVEGHHPKIRFVSGLLSGIIAGTIYQLAQWGYIHFQVGVASYNAIYGSFAALPLFLVWLQMSWLIVLFGAAISTAHQNADIDEFAPESQRISLSCRRILSLQAAHLLIKNFADSNPPLTEQQVSEQLEIPMFLTKQILTDLSDCNIITYTRTDEDKEGGYQPGRDINILNICYVIDALEQKGVNSLPMSRTETFNTLSDTLQKFNEILEKSPGNKLLKDI